MVSPAEMDRAVQDAEQGHVSSRKDYRDDVVEEQRAQPSEHSPLLLSHSDPKKLKRLLLDETDSIVVRVSCWCGACSCGH
jgi:hypothetical protein